MRALVLYDSAYGNTAQIADAIRSGLACDAAAHVIADIDPLKLPAIDLLVIGSPTQGGKPTFAMQTWLDRIPRSALARTKFATFDTRVEARAQNVGLRFLMGVIGYAAPRIARSLSAKGASQIASPQGFIVTGKEGPLAEGEKKRAASWAAAIAKG